MVRMPKRSETIKRLCNEIQWDSDGNWNGIRYRVAFAGYILYNG